MVVNLLTVGMDRTDLKDQLTPLKETVSYINTLGLQKIFMFSDYLYNVDPHSTTFTTVTSTQKKNYFIWGYDTGRYLQ